MVHRFGHNLLVHIVGQFFPFFLASMAYRCATEPMARGGVIAQVVMGLVFATLALLVATLYLTSGINRYAISAEGFRVRRLFFSRLYPWTEIKHIQQVPGLNAITIQGRQGRIAYTSIDYFPHIDEFLFLLQQHSGCTVSPGLIYRSGGMDDEEDEEDEEEFSDKRA